MKAAGALNISVRHVKRLLSRYQQQGIDALISKRRGQPSNNQIPKQLKQLVLKLIRENYQDFGATFAHEKLFECHSHLFSRSFSIETLRKWMIEARLHQPKRSIAGLKDELNRAHSSHLSTMQLQLSPYCVSFMPRPLLTTCSA